MFANFAVISPSLLACEAQTHFRSSLLSLRKIAIFRRERSDDRKCVCASQATSLLENHVIINMSKLALLDTKFGFNFLHFN